MNYYNEFDPKAAAWLRELIRAGEIPPGDVDTRSITEISPHELTGYTQHHFFAGIGGWSLALKLAGWPIDRPVRTGSCPCQPFSAAGKQLGTADERHLWPVFRDIITFGSPTVTFGEQVASALGRQWLAGVRADLEGVGYAVGAADLCAAGVGAPHIRQRLYWVADPDGWRLNKRQKQDGEAQQGDGVSHRPDVGGCGGHGSARAVADTDGGDASAERLQRSGKHGQRPEDGCARGLGDANGSGLSEQRGAVAVSSQQSAAELRGDTGYWGRFDLLPCTDGKTRRIEPGSFPLAHGIPGRVGLLRGYGNAIVPQVAAEFIGAYLDATGG